jgi:hypothetical protein
LAAILLELCRKSFFFSHKVIWFINSLSQQDWERANINVNWLKSEIEAVQPKLRYFIGFGKQLSKLLKKESKDEVEWFDTLESIKLYRQSKHCGMAHPLYIPLPTFGSDDPFQSTLQFYDALREISFSIDQVNFKLHYLQDALDRLNSKLPACVYIPFNSASARNSCILQVPRAEAVVFSTKARTPFKIAVEVFSPYEELQAEEPAPRMTASFSLQSDNSTCTNEVGFFEPRDSIDLLRVCDLRVVQEEEPAYMSISYFSDAPSGANYAEDEDNENYFQESTASQEARVRSSSPFGGLRTWKLVNLIVKSGDDLRQEQLAVQLFSFFSQIFKENKLGLRDNRVCGQRDVA